jgi:hypothetical protein
MIETYADIFLLATAAISGAFLYSLIYYANCIPGDERPFPEASDIADCDVGQNVAIAVFFIGVAACMTLGYMYTSPVLSLAATGFILLPGIWLFIKIIITDSAWYEKKSLERRVMANARNGVLPSPPKS